LNTIFWESTINGKLYEFDCEKINKKITLKINGAEYNTNFKYNNLSGRTEAKAIVDEMEVMVVLEGSKGKITDGDVVIQGKYSKTGEEYFCFPVAITYTILLLTIIPFVLIFNYGYINTAIYAAIVGSLQVLIIDTLVKNSSRKEKVVGVILITVLCVIINTILQFLLSMVSNNL
jgi:hypothetical protein